MSIQRRDETAWQMKLLALRTHGLLLFLESQPRHNPYQETLQSGVNFLSFATDTTCAEGARLLITWFGTAYLHILFVCVWSPILLYFSTCSTVKMLLTHSHNMFPHLLPKSGGHFLTSRSYYNRNASFINEIRHSRDTMFVNFHTSWLIQTNRDKTPWSASWLPPFSRYGAEHNLLVQVQPFTK
jgi:hypothetical protein